MSQYRSANLINIDRVKVVMKRSPAHSPPPIKVAPIKRVVSPKPVISQGRPAPTPQPKLIRHTPRPVGTPRVIPPQSQPAVAAVRSNRQQLRSAENQRRLSNRPKETSIEAYRDNIMRLKGSGQGRILVILACGPSVNEIPIERLANNPRIDIMCINKPNARIWPARYWAFCDQTQYSRNVHYWEGFHGTIINASSVRARHRNQVLIKNISGVGFSKDLVKGFYIGRSTTYANMQTALWMDYPKVYIFGCDMAAVNGELHCYGKNPDVSPENRLQRFKQEADSYEHATKVLTLEERNRFVFCSNYNTFGFIDNYQRLDHTKAVDTILEMARTIH